MPKFVGTPKKSRGRSGRLWEKSRAACLSRSQICWICAGEAADAEYAPFSWDKLPFESTAIDLGLAWPNPASASVDHIIPISMLSPDDPRLWKLEFLRPSHLRCNSARGDGRNGDRIKTVTSRNWLA
jgi:5-methylcytosine-specific restriction endonuclease McrA